MAVNGCKWLKGLDMTENCMKWLEMADDHNNDDDDVEESNWMAL